MLHNRRAKTPVDAAPCPVKTDDKMIDLWLYGRSPNTEAGYRHDIKCLLTSADKSLSGLTLADLQAFDRLGAERGLAAASRYRRLSSIRSLLHFALCCGYVSFDVSAALVFPKIPNTLAERILSVEEVGRLFQVLERRCAGASLPDGTYSVRELAEALRTSRQVVWETAKSQAWPFTRGLREVSWGGRLQHLYAWETVASWCAPVVLGPGWYSARDLAAAVYCTQAIVWHAAQKNGWPYQTVIRKNKTRVRVKLYHSDCARGIGALSRALRDSALVHLLYYGGLRISEALSLRWRAFRETTGGGALVTVFGKGGKTRTVCLPPQAWQAIKRIQGDARPSAVVIWGESPERPLTREHTTRILKCLAREASVSEGLSPHWFRHSHATHALDNGAPIHLVQATLGHSSLMSTEKYLHANPERSSGEYLPDPTAEPIGKACAKRAAPVILHLPGARATG